MRGACNGNNLEIINLLISWGADNWKYGLVGACDGGHIEIVKMMIEKIQYFNSSLFINYLRCGLAAACKNRKIHCVKYILEIAVTHNVKNHRFVLNGLYYACWGGDIDLIKLMSSDNYNLSPDLFAVACLGDSIIAIEYVMKKILATTHLTLKNYEQAIDFTIRNNNLDSLKYVFNEMTKFGAINTYNWDEGLIIACSNINFEMVSFIMG